MDDQKENVEAEEQDEVTPEDLKTMPRHLYVLYVEETDVCDPVGFCPP